MKILNYFAQFHKEIRAEFQLKSIEPQILQNNSNNPEKLGIQILRVSRPI